MTFTFLFAAAASAAPPIGVVQPAPVAAALALAEGFLEEPLSGKPLGLAGLADVRLPRLATDAGTAAASLTAAAGAAGDAPALAAAISSLPPPLVPAVASIVDAAGRALALRDEALAALSPEELAQAETLLPLGGRVSEVVAGERASQTDRRIPGIDEPLGAKVDLAKLALAQALLLDAVEAALPALSSAQAAGASPVDLSPYLAVDNTASTTWLKDYYVAIDLTGNDVYRNRQAATVAGTPAVQVIVDVSGDDRYLAGGDVESVVAQGVGRSGVALLFDAAGNDQYLAEIARIVPDLTPAKNGVVTAQGVGILGAGALVDLGGANRFSASARTRGGTAEVLAQGAGSTGVGLVVATGREGGQTFALEAVSDLLLTFESPNERRWSIGTGIAAGQGYGSGANGVLGSPSRDSYTLRASGGFANAFGQGYSTSGAAVLADPGGDDVYDLRSTGDVTLLNVNRATCPSGYICSFFATTTVTAGDSSTIGQGAARGGAGVLLDLGGSNRFSLGATSRAAAITGVTFGGGGGIAGEYRATSVATTNDAQGTGQGAVTGPGVALLASATGSDAYVFDVASDALADAFAYGGRTNVPSATATSGDAVGVTKAAAVAQGAAALLDLGGSDAYASSAKTTAKATQNGSPGSASKGAASLYGGGAARGNGIAAHLDLGGRDSYSGLPGPVNGKCWTNSPPGLPGDRNVAVGMDFEGSVDATCAGLPN